VNCHPENEYKTLRARPDHHFTRRIMYPFQATQTWIAESSVVRCALERNRLSPGAWNGWSGWNNRQLEHG
jgi:hypothetical protein